MRRFRDGELSEWSMVPDSKSGVPKGTKGSNPLLSAKAVTPAAQASNGVTQTKWSTSPAPRGAGRRHLATREGPAKTLAEKRTSKNA